MIPKDNCMKQILPLFCLVLLFGFFGSDLQAQNLRSYEKAGDQAYERAEYYTALYFYEIVLAKKAKPNLQYKYAQAARQAYAYDKASQAYAKVLNSPEKNLFPEAELYYALTLKHQARYAEAQQAFQNFAQSYQGPDTLKKLKAQKEIIACEKAQILQKQTRPDIFVQRLNNKINTDYSDFSPIWVDSFFYYSSMSFEPAEEKNKKKDKKNKNSLQREDLAKNKVAKILRAQNDQSQGYPLPIINAPDRHNANPTVSADGQRLYFSRCQAQRNDSLICQIYLARRQANGEWGNPRKLPAPVNPDDCPCTNTQPHLAYDPETQREWLFWASNRQGGYGGLDLYKVEVFNQGSNFGLARNLGPEINSPEDEITPFLHWPSKTLYFASDWHEGFGGFDLFSATWLNDSLWTKPQNLGLPFNSAANDMQLYLRDSIGYLASNRSGSLTLVGESCCNDIYRFSLPPNRPIPAPPSSEHPPLVQVDKPQTTTNDPPQPNQPEPPLVQVDKPQTTTNDPPQPNQPEPPLVQVDKPQTTTNDPPQPNQPEPPLTQVDTPQKEQIITSKMQELNQMLPLRLYFHNDEPDSNSRATTTLKPYDLPYFFYLDLEDEYVQEHGRQFSPEMRPVAQAKVREFFTYEVKGEYNRMNQFFDKILELLDLGITLEIHIKGYTSPRSNEAYNDALAQRRITSVRKQLFIYKNGIFMKHFQAGRFSVKELPLGERQSPRGVNDRMDDPANSIYSVEASRERRAEIVVIRRGS